MKFDIDSQAYFTDNTDTGHLICPINTPERHLLRAVLGRTLLDIKCPVGIQKMNDRRQAINWITGKLKDPNGFSFKEVCEWLSDRPEELARKIIEFCWSDLPMKFKACYFSSETHISYEKTYTHKPRKGGRNNKLGFGT